MSINDNPEVSLVSGRQTVATPGTPVQLSATDKSPYAWVIVAAMTGNTNPVTIGGSDVVGALATRKGIPLSPSTPPVKLSIDQLSDIYVDAITIGEGVTFIAGVN